MADVSINTKKPEKHQDGALKKIEELYRVGAHFGYSRSRSHPKMRPYFLGLRNNMEVFDLEKTYPLFQSALQFVEDLAAQGKEILLVSTKPEIRDLIEKIGRELGLPYVVERWFGGTLTNFGVIKKRITYFKDLKEKVLLLALQRKKWRVWIDS
jgi:small subunit ribosomal protein S2